MSIAEVNRMESSGFTALHVASSEGHEKIVELLLAKGASHSTANKHGLMPLDLAEKDEIKQLICHRINKTRFVSDSLNWIIAATADLQAHQYSKKLETYGKDPHVDRLITFIKQNYIEKQLQHIEDIGRIKLCFNKAIHEQDLVHLLRAYIAETGFYSVLNTHLKKIQLDNLTNDENLGVAYYTGIIAHHPRFETFSFTGTVFRGMIMTTDDLKQHEIGTRLLTQTFSSASKQRNVVFDFLAGVDHSKDQLTTMCTYEIRNQRTALDIHQISLFECEEEVLLLPYSAFKIMDIQIDKNNSRHVEIRLKECDSW